MNVARRRRVALVSILTALGGLVALLPYVPRLHRGIQFLDSALLPIRPRAGMHVVSVIMGLALVYLAVQLWHRKHLAWQLTLALYALSALVHVLKGPNAIPTVYGVLMVVLLVWARADFGAQSDPPTLLRAVWFVPSYLVLVYTFGLVSIFVERHEIDPSPTFTASLRAITAGLMGFDGPYTYENPLFKRAFPITLVLLAVIGIVVLAYLVFRPIAARPEPDDEDWERATRLVRTYGWDTLAYFSLRPDKCFFFASDGEAMIAYAYVARTALVSADPIGREESIPLVVDEFLAFTLERGWSVAFLAARQSSADLYRERSLRTFYLGDEAILHCRDFGLEGKKMKGVRQASNRVGRSYTFQVAAESDLVPGVVERCNDISRRWRGKNPERGFTMALSEDLTGDNPDFLVVWATDADGGVGGFLRFVPAYGDDFGYTLDLMRHDPDAPNGMTEFLMAQTALALKERGIDRLSMNFAAWSRVWQADVDLTRRERLGRWFVQRLNPYFQIKSLYDFNQKFGPEWFPRAIVHDGTTSLPRVGILFARLEGFLNVPVVGRYLVPRVVTKPEAAQRARRAAETGVARQPGV